MVVTIDRFGRILIPKPVREAHGLRPGARIRIGETEAGILLEPELDEPPVVYERNVLVFNGLPDGDLSGAVDGDRDGRLDDLVRGGRLP
jgi:AbrB family looped-hinge helix DNA binding protein